VDSLAKVEMLAVTPRRALGVTVAEASFIASELKA
jgi:hypothetical protein